MTSRRTAAITRPAKSRANKRPGSASWPTCCARPRSARRRSRPTKVAPGTQVTIAFGGDESDTDTFVLGSRELLGLDDSVDTNVYSPQSPLGAAILGKKQGDEASYAAPNGRSITVTVVKIEPFRG